MANISSSPTYGQVVRCGPNSKTPGQWARVLASSSDGKRVWLAVFPPNSHKPKKLER